MYYERFQQHVENSTENYNVSIQKQENVCRIIPGESMSVGAFRNLFVELKNIDNFNVHMSNPHYIIVQHDI